MVQSFLGCRSLERIDLKKPSDEVQEVLVFTLQALLQGRLLGNKDVDLEFFIVSGRRLGFLLALTLVFVVSAGFLVDETLTSEEVRHKSSFFHHVLRNWSDDADDSRKQALHRVVLEKYVACEELSQDATETPNVNLVVIAAPKDDLRSTITT